MFQNYTIKDIAKALGLSTSTVSRALNGSYEIGSETKKLVLEYAEKVNYRPNPIALSLKEQKSRSIGVVVSEVANNYFSQAINGIESIAYNSGYHVILTQTHESAAREAANVQHLLSRHVDGLLVSLSAETIDIEPYQYLHDKGFPIVFFDRVPQSIDTHKVTANNYKGAYEATELLVRSGYKRIAHLTSSANLLISQERLAGYKDALAQHQVTVAAACIKHCNSGGMITAEVEDAVRELMNLHEKPDAIVIAGDKLTTCFMACIKRIGLKIPNDIAVVGFTNSNVAELFDPPLSAVRQPAFQMGQTATELLIKTIQSKYPIYDHEICKLETELMPRASSPTVS